MRKIPFIVISFLFFLGLFILLNNITSQKPTLYIPEKAILKTPQVSATPQEVIATPKILKIPKIGVNTNMESVAMDSQGRMDVPKNVDNVAWYNLGPKPGEEGSAVVSGHFDKVTGAPAVFYRIGELRVGDAIVAIDQQNKEYKYRVTNVKVFPYDKLPLNDIFARGGGRFLNLITCGGEWDPQSKNYSTRTVVYSEIVK